MDAQQWFRRTSMIYLTFMVPGNMCYLWSMAARAGGLKPPQIIWMLLFDILALAIASVQGLGIAVVTKVIGGVGQGLLVQALIGLAIGAVTMVWAFSAPGGLLFVIGTVCGGAGAALAAIKHPTASRPWWAAFAAVSLVSLLLIYIGTNVS